eukprot:7391782-Prymnesium_polylepis.2
MTVSFWVEGVGYRHAGRRQLCDGSVPRTFDHIINRQVETAHSRVLLEAVDTGCVPPSATTPGADTAGADAAGADAAGADERRQEGCARRAHVVQAQGGGGQPEGV